MKKSIFTTIVLLFLLGCGTNSTTTNSPNQSNDSQESYDTPINSYPNSNMDTSMQNPTEVLIIQFCMNLLS